MGTFWELTTPKSQRKRAVIADEMPLGEIIICPVNPAGHRRGGRQTSDLMIVLPDAEVEEFVWTWTHELTIREDTLALLRQEGVTGFEVRPVHARFAKSHRKPPILWEIVVTGWAGIAPPESGVRPWPEKGCLACDDKVYTGFTDGSKLISEQQWDGSDIFVVWPLSKFKFTSSRLKSLVELHGWRGCRFVNPADLSFDNSFPLRGGRLREVMPDERARELGEPLGIY